MNNDLEILLNGQQFKRIYEKECDQISTAYSLTKLEIEILLFLENKKQYDRAKDIVKLRYFAKSHVSKAITSMIDRGYIIGKPDEHDRRCIHLRVSDEAKDVLQAANKMRNDLVGILYKGITLEERIKMDIIANKMVSNIREALEKQNYV